MLLQCDSKEKVDEIIRQTLYIPEKHKNLLPLVTEDLCNSDYSGSTFPAVSSEAISYAAASPGTTSSTAAASWYSQPGVKVIIESIRISTVPTIFIEVSGS